MNDSPLTEIEIPVIIAHFDSKPHYLKLALQSAAKFNKTVVLIGDAANKNFWKNHWDTTLGDFAKFSEFLKHYTQMSNYPKKYEMSFWKRMFVLEIWMKENGYKKIFVLDSDMLTFVDYSKEVYPILPHDCIASLMTPEKQDNFAWASSCHFSYWTLEALEDFTNFCIEAYKNKNIRDQLEAKWQWHIDNRQFGGVCEMTLLYLWSKDNPRVINFTKIWNEMTADLNFNLSEQYHRDEYEMRFGLKKFIFNEGVPYGYNKLLNKWIKFCCIHCQGTGKYAMTFLSHRHLRRIYLLPRILHRIKSKYFRLSFRKITQRRQQKLKESAQ